MMRSCFLWKGIVDHAREFRTRVEPSVAEVVGVEGTTATMPEMQKTRKLRVSGSAKKAARKATRRQARKNSTAPGLATRVKLDVPLVEAPPTQVAHFQPMFFWPAFPIAMLRMWLGPRDAGMAK
jgi:hypothetical protein